MSFLNDGLRVSVNEINGLGKGAYYYSIVGLHPTPYSCELLELPRDFLGMEKADAALE